jgi:hypothetical protein
VLTALGSTCTLTPPVKLRKMSSSDIIDHSPQQPIASPPVSTASNLIFIDNYDSFTWNIYQYLVLEGATVHVMFLCEAKKILSIRTEQLGASHQISVKELVLMYSHTASITSFSTNT